MAGGEAAAKYALEHDVDVVLMDIRMPDGDGLTALGRIKLDKPEMPRRRFQVLQAWNPAEHRIAQIDNGPADHPGVTLGPGPVEDHPGDLDIVAASRLPPPARPPNVAATSPVSIVCLEQTEPRVFVRHTLEAGAPYYATLEVADFDSDGDLDFAVGPGVSQ